MKIWKKNLVAAAVLLTVCGGIYANWKYGQEQAVSDLTDTLDENKILSSDYSQKLNDTVLRIEKFKSALTERGYVFYGNEPMKITICAKEIGYTGEQLNELLKSKNIFVEFYDQDYVVLMPTTQTTPDQFEQLQNCLLSIEIRPKILSLPPKTYLPRKAISIRNATFSPCETVSINRAKGRILADVAVTCPPAVPVIVSGEIIDDFVIERFNYYGITKCKVVKE